MIQQQNKPNVCQKVISIMKNGKFVFETDNKLFFEYPEFRNLFKYHSHSEKIEEIFPEKNEKIHKKFLKYLYYANFLNNSARNRIEKELKMFRLGEENENQRKIIQVFKEHCMIGNLDPKKLEKKQRPVAEKGRKIIWNSKLEEINLIPKKAK